MCKTQPVILNAVCEESSGVFPLVCAVCKRVVGIVNVSEFLRMAGAGEVYICSECMHLPETFIEFKLEKFTAATWADMTVQASQAHTTAADLNHTCVPLVYQVGRETIRVGLL